MNMVFLKLLDNCAVIKLDKLLILCKMAEDHRKALDTVFALLEKH